MKRNATFFLKQQNSRSETSCVESARACGQLVFLCTRIVLVVRCCVTALQVKAILWAVQNKNEHNHTFSRYLIQII